MSSSVHWWKARVTFPGAEPIELLAVLTADPQGYKEGLELTYEAGVVEVWAVDEQGNPIQVKND